MVLWDECGTNSSHARFHGPASSASGRPDSCRNEAEVHWSRARSYPASRAGGKNSRQRTTARAGRCSVWTLQSSTVRRSVDDRSLRSVRVGVKAHDEGPRRGGAPRLVLLMQLSQAISGKGAASSEVVYEFLAGRRRGVVT
jgi:hypothetical protein